MPDTPEGPNQTQKPIEQPKKPLSSLEKVFADVASNYKISIEGVDLIEYFEKGWKEYSPQQSLSSRLDEGKSDPLRIMGGFTAKIPAITVATAELLTTHGEFSNKLLNAEMFKQQEQEKPFDGMKALSIGGLELEAFVPWGLHVTDVDPRLDKLSLPTISGVQRISEKIDRSFSEKYPDFGVVDVVMCCRVFEFSSGAEDDELPGIAETIYTSLKPNGVAIIEGELSVLNKLFPTEKFERKFELSEPIQPGTQAFDGVWVLRKK